MPNKKENRTLFYILSLTWGLLMTLMGLFTFLFVMTFMKRSVDSVEVIAGRVCIMTNIKKLGGVSLGLFYMVGYYLKKDEDTHLHELGHSIQNIKWGPLFLPVIGIPSIVRASLWDFIKKHKKNADYYSIWFEGKATELGYKYLFEEVSNGLFEIYHKQRRYY